ncbi:DUF3857 domain-containing protein [Tenacibaculum tangerinum]|uniref:DUF3857 domain-containing protein n=1 Tax=Tenacibaculum tangerinum TaxID=3038772 RepID=A0ABY8KYH7_9FLAO|nr:DUF3857 domain-containing protein [Tenacibaculum tangerinum]WGH74074.1 DUF3857 domain-containing protein [Tenacibaculum tangerinum]
MKRLTAIIVFLCVTNAFAQKNKSTKIGNITVEELSMQRYEPDTTANAVVVYEHANYYLDEKRDYKKTTDFYFKIKILKKEGVEKATVSIPYYGDEKVHSVKGITYNLTENNNILKNHLIESEVYQKDVYGKWKEITFTLSNVKEGSVIEYTYSVTSPYSKIDDWYFQADIPKIKSDFTASILGNWKYNIRIVGFLKLTRNDSFAKKGCVYIPGLGEGACLILNYGIDNIPAFKEEEYMLSKENFISKLSFELESFHNPKGGVDRYTKTWKDADKSLRYDFLDNQTSKKNFFKNQLPPALLSIEDDLKRAKKAYRFIQHHFIWNEKYWPSKKVRIKEAFEDKTGTIFDINLSLYNALQAAQIESYLVLTSTRNKAVPTKLHPIVDDFNYLLVKAVINDKTYFLDATHKQLPFGLVRYESLNGDGRVLDFKKGSYWEPIELKRKTFRNVRTQLLLDEDLTLSGELTISSDGFFALHEREKLSNVSRESYLEDFESEHSNLEVEDFKHENLDEKDAPLHQKFSIIFDDVALKTNLRINPFLIEKVTKNPFKLNQRDYPVDYGYPRNISYVLSLKLPEGYIVKKIPENKAFALPNKGGRFVASFKSTNNSISVYSKISLNKRVFSSDEYHYLKEFYNQIINTHNSFIEIEKVSR